MRVRLLAAISALVLLPACSGLAEKIERDFPQKEAGATGLVKEVGRTASGGATAAPVAHEPGIWLGKNIVKLGQPTLPPIFYQPATFDRSVNSLAELAERIALRAGIPTKLSPEALGVANGNGSEGAAAAAPAGRGNVGAAGPGANSGRRGNGPVRLTYNNGNFKGLLDTAAARFGVYWKYVDGSIEFFCTESRTFQINAIPGDSSMSANITSGAGSTGGVAGGGGTAGAASGVSTSNSQNIAVASKLSVYASIEKSVGAMLSVYGRVVASPATGAITVVDTPDTLERVAAFIEGENKSLSRQVVINVTVLSVNLADADEYGINWNLVYQGLSNKYGIKNNAAAGSNSVGFSAGILATASSKLAGTALVINALSEQGKVRRQTTASVVTLNNQPVPVQVARQTSYLQSSQTTVTALVGASTTLTPGSVTAGFNMSILPHVLANGTVMLQFSTDISSLRGIRTVSSNGSSIETPEMDTRNFLQRVAMKSNETLIISGFEQSDDNLERSGVGAAANYLFGGGFKAKSSKEVIVVLVTPTTMGSL